MAKVSSAVQYIGKPPDMSIPLYLCVYALRFKKVNQLKVYVALKYYCSGYYNATPENNLMMASVLGITLVSFRSNLKKLVVDKWVLPCKSKKVYWIRGYKQLGIVLRNSTISCIKLSSKDFKNFKAIIISGVYAKIVRDSRRRNRGSVWLYGWRTLIRILPPSTYLIANTYLAKVLHISKTTAYDYKYLAEKAGYISTMENLEQLFVGKNSPVPLNAEIMQIFAETNNIRSETLRTKQRKAFLQRPDSITYKVEIYSKRSLKRRKKTEPLFMGGYRRVKHPGEKQTKSNISLDSKEIPKLKNKVNGE